MKDSFNTETIRENLFLVVRWIIVTFGNSISIIGHISLCPLAVHLLSALRVIVAAVHVLGTLCVVAVAVHLLGALRVIGGAHLRLLSTIDAVTALLIVALLIEALLVEATLLLLLVHALAHVLAIGLRARMHWAGLVFLGGSLVVIRRSGHDGQVGE